MSVCKRIIVLFIVSAVCVLSFPQSVLTGFISDNGGDPLVGATIVFEGSQTGGVTNAEGTFKIESDFTGKQTLLVSYIGYISKSINVDLDDNKTTTVNVSLISDKNQLQEVTVQGKSKEQVMREAPIKIEVIDLKQVQGRSVSLPQLINQTSGVKVRQNGGVGSSTVININGLQGNAIRFFRDDIPMDYLGKAFNLSLLPVEQIANIEIYKGVLPVKLGADALGGAVNLVSSVNSDNQLDVSYSFGSFNSHLATVNGYYKIPKTKLFVSASSYFVYSDNNYKIFVDIADEETGNPYEDEVERFHGGVKSGFVEFKAGVKNVAFADLLEVGTAFSDIDKELQNDFRNENVFGEVMYYENLKNVTTHYIKRTQKFEVNLFGAYSKLNSLYDDTPENTYDWYGNATPITEENHSGESNDDWQSYRKLEFDHIVGRLNLNYRINENHEINVNHNYIYQNRIGSDPYTKTSSYGVDALTIPAKYIRNISGVGLTSNMFRKKITNVFTIKRYGVNTHSVATSYDYYGEVNEVSANNYGLGNSLKYSFNSHRYLRLSYEKATRIPSTTEYLGDSEKDIMGNPDLEPERSDNINLGMYSNLNKSKTFWLDLNLFYRYVEDNIVLKTYTIYQSRYENTDDSRVLGGEMALKSKPVPQLDVNLSLTYQDIRRKNVENISDILLADARRPNIPYFFGNVWMRWNPDRLFLDGNWQFYGNYTYVEQYLLNAILKSEEPALFEEANSDSNIIPTQNIVDTGILYKMTKLPVSVNLEVNNLLNTRAYDGFRVQKPGRNFRVKLKYSFN